MFRTINYKDVVFLENPYVTVGRSFLQQARSTSLLLFRNETFVFFTEGYSQFELKQSLNLEYLYENPKRDSTVIQACVHAVPPEAL